MTIVRCEKVLRKKRQRNRNFLSAEKGFFFIKQDIDCNCLKGVNLLLLGIGSPNHPHVPNLKRKDLSEWQKIESIASRFKENIIFLLSFNILGMKPD